MLDRTQATAALALLLALFAISPAAAAAHKRAVHPGFEARAEALGGELATRAATRMQALRKCNEEAAPLRDYTWGMEQSDRYRACMAEHGQPE